MRNKILKFFILLSILAILSSACQFSGANQSVKLPTATITRQREVTATSSEPRLPTATNSIPNAVNPTVQQQKPAGFSKEDCNVSGITFPDITVDYIVDDIYDGPYLTCSFSNIGSHGLSETAYISIGAYKPASLDEFYLDHQQNIQGFVDQAAEWNAYPDLSPDLKKEITFLSKNEDGYVFLITGLANVQNCLNGKGYGVEKVNGKYLVQLTFNSCEGDAGSYQTTFLNMWNAATDAINRVEAKANP